MDATGVQSVVPREQSGRIVCECGATMAPTIGWRMDSTDYGLVRWLYWTCSKGHATDALPVPTLMMQDR